MNTARGLLALALLAAASPSRAQVFPYESVGQGGRNNIIDSNGESCDNSAFVGGVWTPPNGGQGCYNRHGGLCSADPNHMCDLQLIPKGRCTYGDLAANGGPGGTNTCVWPHGAGRCTGNTHVGCVTDAYISSGGTVTATGVSNMCSGTPGGVNTCDMTIDPYGGPFRTACVCDGENAAAANFETAVCGTAGGTLKAVCSDGDPERDTGGYGTALGVELNLGSGNVSFAAMGPAVTGATTPVSSPPYALEDIPSNDTIEPQRGAGSINRPGAAVTPIHEGRATEARDINANFNAALGITKAVSFGDSYWGDSGFASAPVTGTFNTHIVVFSCDPPVGFATDQKIDPTPAAPNSGDEAYCSQQGRDGISFQWSRNLTPAEQALPTCPPACKKDFDITTTEIEAFIAAGLQDPDAGAQLAIQSGEGPSVGAGDVIGVAVVTSATWLNSNDMRCRMGGWGSPAGEIGRCFDGPASCNPALNDANGNQPACAAQGNGCRACNGPISVSNPLGMPIGYNTHGLPELDLALGERIGGIAGVTSLVRVPLFVVGTTGFAASDFRDLPGTAVGSLDLADMGLVDVLGSPFAVGVGAGGTFGTGLLPIGENCCTTTPNGPAGRHSDRVAAGCGGRSGHHVQPRVRPRSGSGRHPWMHERHDGGDQRSERLQPAAGQGRQRREDERVLRDRPGRPGDDLQRGLVGDHPGFGESLRPARREPCGRLALHGCAVQLRQPEPEVLQLDRVVHVPGHRSLRAAEHRHPGQGEHDVLPARGQQLRTAPTPIVLTVIDGDGICDDVDNCPTVANPDQADSDADGVGNVCDNCTAVSNPRVAANFTTTNPWATLTGGQRDDDHDGYGNKCDAKFPGVTGLLVGAGDLTQFRASNGKNRTGDTCGTSGTRPCAIFDLDEGTAALLGPADLAQFRALNGKAPGPKCATCPQACTAGTAGTCGAIP